MVSFQRYLAAISILMLLLAQGYFLSGNANQLAFAQQRQEREDPDLKCKQDATRLIPGLGGMDAKCGKVKEAVEHSGAQVYIDSVTYFDSYVDVLGKHMAAPGNKFVSVDVTLKNTGNATLYQDALSYAVFFPNMQDWEGKMKTNGTKDCGFLSCSFVITSRAATRDTIPAALQPGDTIRGTAYFEVPTNEKNLTFLYEISGLQKSGTDLAKVAIFDLSTNKSPPDKRPASNSAPSSDLEVGLSSNNGAIQIKIDSKRAENSVKAGGNTFTAPEGWTAYVLGISLINNGSTDLLLNKTRMYVRDANDYGFIAFPAEDNGTKENRNIVLGAGETAKITVASFVPEGSKYFTFVYFDGVGADGRVASMSNVVVIPEFPGSLAIMLTSGLILLAAISLARFHPRLSIQ